MPTHCFTVAAAAAVQMCLAGDARARVEDQSEVFLLGRARLSFVRYLAEGRANVRLDTRIYSACLLYEGRGCCGSWGLLGEAQRRGCWMLSSRLLETALLDDVVHFATCSTGTVLYR